MRSLFCNPPTVKFAVNAIVVSGAMIIFSIFALPMFLHPDSSSLRAVTVFGVMGIVVAILVYCSVLLDRARATEQSSVSSK